MKVTRMTATPLSVPMDYPFQSPFGGMFAIVNPVIVQLYTDDGADAFGICMATNDSQVKSLKACIEDLAPVVIGQDVARINEAWQKLWVATGGMGMGHSGYGIMAISAIDNALWVLRAKLLNLPLATLLGGYREKVPA